MQKNQIAEVVLEFCFTHGADVNSLTVGYGAAAVMHGIREQTCDIDVDTNNHVFDWVWCMEGAVSGKGLTGQFVSLGDHLDFHIADPCDRVMIDGIWVVTKEVLLRQYEWLYKHPERMPNKRGQDNAVIQALKAGM